MNAPLSEPRPTRRSVLRAGALAPVVLGAGRFRVGREARPSVLFVHTDQQALQSVSGLGYAGARTPSIDRLIARGVAFTESHCADPVCSPARAAWYTGRPSSESGVVENQRPLWKKVPDLGQWLGDGGYDPFYVGKWHIRGRDVAKSFRVVVGKGAFFGILGDRVVSTAAAAFLREHDGKKPFCLNVGFLQPHDVNYWFGRHAARTASIPEGVRARLPELPPSFATRHEEPTPYRQLRKRWLQRSVDAWSEERWRTYLWVYDRYVEMVDAEVGRVLDALEASRHAASTIVIFSSDHGEGLASQGLVNKGHFYEPSIRVPLVASWPGHFPSGHIDREHLVSGLDVFPTLCDFAGIEPPQGVRGRSLRPLLERKEARPADGDWRRFLVCEHMITGRMVRSDRYKLISYDGGGNDLFFDVRADPWETTNLVHEEEHATALEACRKHLREREATLERAPIGDR